MTELIQPGSPEFAAEVARLQGLVEEIKTETERRYEAPKPPRPSPRALRHRRENAAAAAKKANRKRGRR